MTIAYSGYRSGETTTLTVENAYIARPKWVPYAFLVPLVFAGVSWMGQGVTALTDMAFVIFTLLGFVLLIMEFVVFPRRFGIGAMMILGGFLTWFCHDYFSNWYGWPFADQSAPHSPNVIAKAAFYHILFVTCAMIGLAFPVRKAYRVLQLVPEPNDSKLYFGIVLALFIVGISPYFLFSRDPWYLAIYNSIMGGRAGAGAMWVAGRDGRLNYSWGGYIAQILQVGQVSSQLAVFYAILVARNHIQKIICWMIWVLWVALSVGTGTRGVVAFMMLPVLALLFLKYQSGASIALKKVSIKAYVFGAIVLFALVFLVQLQGRYRTLGFKDADLSTINPLELQGNSMFSEGLPGWEAIPDRIGFFSNRFPGESLVRPIPETAFWFVVKAIPRALWNNKPLDPMEEWYYGFASDDKFQATISTGIVGEWYFRYGMLGVVQGGMLFGWLARMAEKALQTAGGRPMVILLSLGLATWLFRTFRNFMFHDLYPLIIGAVVIYFMIRIFNSMSAAPTVAKPQ